MLIRGALKWLTLFCGTFKFILGFLGYFYVFRVVKTVLNKHKVMCISVSQGPGPISVTAGHIIKLKSCGE